MFALYVGAPTYTKYGFCGEQSGGGAPVFASGKIALMKKVFLGKRDCGFILAGCSKMRLAFCSILLKGLEPDAERLEQNALFCGEKKYAIFFYPLLLSPCAI